jgi:GNAT superfamily N-acetyltransferase
MAADAVPGLNIQAAEDCNFCGEPVFGWTCGCPGEKANAVKVKEWMAQNAEPKVEGTKESEKQPIRHCDSCGDTGRWVTRSKQMFPPNIFCGRVDCYKDLGWWTKDPGRVEAYNKFWEAQRHRVQASKVGDLELPDPPKGMTKDNEKEQDITALVGDVPPELQVRWWPVSKKIDVLNVKGEAVPGKIVAYFMASIWVSKKTARIEMIDIAPSERRKGHGKRLATWFTDFARRMGADEVKGEAIPGSEEFWTGIGWDKGGKSRGKHKGMEKVRQDLRAKVTALAYVAAAMNAAVREDWEEALTPEDAKAARALLSYFPWDLGEKELASLDSLVAKYYRTVKGKPVAPIVYTPEAKLRMLENALAALVKVPGQLEDHKAKREGEAWDQNQEREEDEGARLQRENDLRD